MKGININVSEIFENYTGIKSFYFNPSIAQISNNSYLLSARSYLHNPKKSFDNNPDLSKNKQHPWNTDWSGDDKTIIFPVNIIDKQVIPIKNCKSLGYPLKLPFQDLRIFRFIQLGDKITYIVTFNERYEGHYNTVIKGGNLCDDYCYLIGWGYLIIDSKTLKYNYLPGSKPLCPNISNPVEKNWSLWRHDKLDKINLMCSYGLSPVHSAFSFNLSSVNANDGEINAITKCKMLTPRQVDIDKYLRTFEHLNFFRELEKYYDNNLFISLSTPAYPINGDPSSDIYQAVGHLKIKRKYLENLSKNKKLHKFVKNIKIKKYLNPNYIYLMFVYQFKINPIYRKEKIESDNSQIGEIYLDKFVKINAEIIRITPAFVGKVDKQNYYLNFPSGMVINYETDETIISYGDGDKTANLLFLQNKDIKNNMYDLKKLKPKDFDFIVGEINDKNEITF